MFKPVNAIHCRAVALAALLIFATGAYAAAPPPAGGLGQAWPNTQDVSANPAFHVYHFARDGIRYIQINDASGNVLAAFGYAGGQFIVLPIGTASDRVSTPQQPLQLVGPSGGAALIYRGEAIQVSLVAAADGPALQVTQLPGSKVTTMATSNATTNSGGTTTGCDKQECGGDVVQPL